MWKLGASREARFVSLLGLVWGCTQVPAAPRERVSAPSAAPVVVSAAPTASLAPPQTSSSALAPAPTPRPAAFVGGEHAVKSRTGLVVAVEAQAARVGADVLADGGNAVDAAIATVLALCVTHSSAASLGGGGFALVRPRSGATLSFDFRETAPSALERRDFERMQAQGGRGKSAVGVPGVVAGLASLAARAGTRTLNDLAKPALALAKRGFNVGRWEADLFRMSARTLGEDPEARRIFFKRDAPPASGSILRQAALAWTLERIVDGGADAFYRGEVATRLSKALAPMGPSRDDLASYRCIERDVLSVPYGGYTLETMAPPSAGGVALVGSLLMLTRMPASAAGSVAAVHYLLEAQRRAQAERRLGVVDPDSLSADEREKRRTRWLSPEFWLSTPIAEKASPSATLRSTPSEPEREAEHTTHVSVVDRNGLVVSLTTTLSASFGARIVATGTGIVMNNAVASFSSSGENQPRPRARTTSSMAPSLLLSGSEVAAVLGTPGGDTIPSTLAQVVSHLVDEHLSLEAAIEAPRWHQAFLPDQARYEPALKGSALLTELTARGHALRALSRRFGDANCIVLAGDEAFGYADSREPGVAISPGR